MGDQAIDRSAIYLLKHFDSGTTSGTTGVRAITAHFVFRVKYLLTHTTSASRCASTCCKSSRENSA